MGDPGSRYAETLTWLEIDGAPVLGAGFEPVGSWARWSLRTGRPRRARCTQPSASVPRPAATSSTKSGEVSGIGCESAAHDARAFATHRERTVKKRVPAGDLLAANAGRGRFGFLAIERAQHLIDIAEELVQAVEIDRRRRR